MSTTSQMTTESSAAGSHSEAAHEIDRIKRRVRMRKVQEAQRLAARLQVAPDGSPAILRFDRSQRLQHQLLMVSFTLLAITGLLQRYSELLPVQVAINDLLGGVDTVRVIHHLAAILFTVLSIYHIGEIMDSWLVKGQLGAMWPRWRDARDLVQMMGYNLGLAKSRPVHDRYSVEEKLEYWALIWGGAVMIISGIALWFPAWVTRFLPGVVIPISRAIHSWEAVLATLAILTWHTYHVIVKEKNTSIFTGTMTIEEMQESHPLELQRILAAQDYLHRVAESTEVTEKPILQLPQRSEIMAAEHENAD